MRQNVMALLIAVVVSTAVGFGVGCGSSSLPADVPDVRGLALPDARVQLKKAGYAASVTSDAMFGVIIEQNFTVCDEHAPKGKLVPLKVSKNC